MYKIIMPAYNAEKRIYKTLLENMQHNDKIIAVDDGSTDDTSSEVDRFNEDHSAKVTLYKMKKNSKKVGAIRKGVQMIDENMSGIKHVLLMDDDTTLVNTPLDIQSACSRMDDGGYAAVSFKMLPKNTSNFIEKMQAMEYNTAEEIKRFLKESDMQRCVAGAGGLYKMDSLQDALNSHSGEHSADDMEITYILQENGLKVGYFEDILIKTKVPKNISELVKQRRRWQRGIIETTIKKKRYVAENLFEFNKLSLVQGAELASHLTFGALHSVSGLAVNLYLAMSSQNKEDALLLPVYPIYSLGVNIASKCLAYSDVLRESMENRLGAKGDLSYRDSIISNTKTKGFG